MNNKKLFKILLYSLEDTVKDTCPWSPVVIGGLPYPITLLGFTAHLINSDNEIISILTKVNQTKNVAIIITVASCFIVAFAVLFVFKLKFNLKYYAK